MEYESPAHAGSRNESVAAGVAQTQLFLGCGASTLGPVFGFFSNETGDYSVGRTEAEGGLLRVNGRAAGALPRCTGNRCLRLGSLAAP